MFKSIRPEQCEIQFKRIYTCKSCPKGYSNKFIKIYKEQKSCLECERRYLLYKNAKQ